MKPRRRQSILALGVLWLLIADVATAGSYLLVVGKGVEVCEAYLENLNSFPKHPPMVCERPLNPSLTDFSRPKWQPLEFWTNRHLLREAIRQHPSNLKYSDDEFEKVEPLEKWEANLKAGMAAQAMTFGIASLDVDRDGISETVLRFDGGFRCDPTNESNFAYPGGTEFYVLTPDGQHLDVWKSGNFVNAGRPDIFLYKGHVYMSTWAGELKLSDGELVVQTPLHLPGMDTRWCRYTYKAKNQRRGS